RGKATKLRSIFDQAHCRAADRFEDGAVLKTRRLSPATTVVLGNERHRASDGWQADLVEDVGTLEHHAEHAGAVERVVERRARGLLPLVNDALEGASVTVDGRTGN